MNRMGLMIQTKDECERERDFEEEAQKIVSRLKGSADTLEGGDTNIGDMLLQEARTYKSKGISVGRIILGLKMFIEEVEKEGGVTKFFSNLKKELEENKVLRDKFEKSVHSENELWIHDNDQEGPTV